jgi:hypothetical protein
VVVRLARRACGHLRPTGHSNFYTGFRINVVIGMVGLWAMVLLVVPPEAYHWNAVPYFALSYEFPLNMVHRTAALDARTTSETLEGAVICTGVNPNSYNTPSSRRISGWAIGLPRSRLPAVGTAMQKDASMRCPRCEADKVSGANSAMSVAAP